MDLASFAESIKSLLSDNNTITSSTDISSGLAVRTQTFFKGLKDCHKYFPIQINQYPACVVEVESKPEEFRTLGNTAKRNMELKFNVVCITQYTSGAGADAMETAQMESLKLSQNVEGLFRNNVQLSLTSFVLDALVANTEYGILDRTSYYNCISNIEIKAKIYNS
jgi:hypothetical protein